jgi:Ca2+-binding RTX toxin-like protein
MTISADLFKAVLAMDAYNRGVNAGINVSGSQIGSALLRSDLLPSGSSEASFSAQAYSWNGETIISYRGTDILPAILGGHAPTYSTNSWVDVGQWVLLRAGNYDATQLRLAAQFYQQIKTDVGSGTIETTGHSLGGALAGFVAALYGSNAELFDTIWFTVAARNLYDAVTTGVPIVSEGQVSYVIDTEALNYFFNGQAPTAPFTFPSSQFAGYSLQGEVATQYATTAEERALLQMIAQTSNLGNVDLHSQALLVINLFAQQQISQTSWKGVSSPLFASLFDDAVAQKVGFKLNTTGAADAWSQMQSAIAYSVIDDGTKPFGDKAIRAFFNDGNELGQLAASAGLAAYLSDTRVQYALSQIIAEYAGVLAKSQAVDSSTTSATTGLEKGALFYDGGNRLVADFSHSLWTVGEAQVDILGKKTLTDAVSTSAGSPSSSVNLAVETIWGSHTDNIVKMVAQTDDAPNVTLDAVADAQITHGDDIPATDGAMLVGGGGKNTLSGASGNDLLVGGGGDDTFTGGGGSDLMFGGSGDDTFILGDGTKDWVDGGSGIHDVARYGSESGAHNVSIYGLNGFAPSGDRIVTVTSANDGSKVDYINGVETITLSGTNNTVSVLPLGHVVKSSLTSIDLGATLYSSGETLDFSAYGASVYLSSSLTSDAGAVALYSDKDYQRETDLEFQKFNTLILSSYDDKVLLRSSDDPYLHLLYTGHGSDDVWSDILNLQIFTAVDSGDVGHIEHAGKGSIVNLGTGHGEIFVSDDLLVVGAKATDVFASVGGTILHGGTQQTGSESAWVTGPDGTRYGLNKDGQLVIMDKSGATMFVANYKGGPDVPLDQQTGSILLAKVEWDALRLVDFTRPSTEADTETIKAGNALVYVKTGHKFFDTDPLVLDLNGDGIHLVATSVGSPLFDINNTGFGIHTGWVQPDDGMLFYDKNSNGQVDSGRELFGGQGDVGFDALANYDLNADGVIDASDAIYSQLQVWRDINDNGVADSGELQSLATSGISSISLTTTAPVDPDIAGNTVNAVGTFTRTDGSTGTIAGVSFNSDPFHSNYLGDKTVSTEAAALPDLKGYGTLTDLRVAMTLDPTLIDVVEANLPNLNVPDLNALRTAALPIFAAWAEAVSLLDADGNPQAAVPSSHRDVPILVDMSSGAPSVVDFAYYFTDENDVSYWKLASGDDVLDAQGEVIDHPTLAQVLAQTSTDGAWQDFTPGEISFMERYMGQSFPFELLSEDPGAVIDAMTSLIGGSWSAMQLLAVRLAVQGPLASYFQGIEYDASDNTFHATTDAQLTPMYQAIFEAAPSDATGALNWLEQWRPIVDVVLGDFVRDGGVDVSYAYTFASLVRAYETVPLPFDIDTTAQAFGVPAGLIFEGGSTVTGTAGADILYLHGGDQLAQGGSGLDNYVIGGQFGDITIDDFEGLGGHQDPDILRFTSIRSTDVTATRDGIDLILTVNATGQQITVLGEFTGVKPGFFGGNFNDDRGVAQIAFSDGVVWDMPDIAWAVSHPQSGSPTVMGTGAMDVLDGGVGGNTYLTGADDGDIYLFGVGYGHDTVDDLQSNPLLESADYVMFNADVSRSDVTFYRNGDSADLQIGINGTDDLLTIAGQFEAGYNILGPMWLNRIEAFVFDGGASYSWEQIIRTMDAQAGTDNDDTIYGFSYEDTLQGGAGDDFISGGNENDTYIFGVGDGHDTILEGATNILAGMTDTLEFREGVLPTDVTYTRDGSTYDLIITLASGDSIRVEDQFGKSYGELWFNRIENFKFDSTGEVVTSEDIIQRILDEAKTSGDDTIYGYYRADVMDGGAGNDYLAGGRDGDTYVWGTGWDNDTVYDVGDGIPDDDNIDKVVLSADLTPDDIAISRGESLDDLVLTIRSTGETLTIQDQFLAFTYGQTFYQIEEFHFSDGTVWNADYFRPALLEQAKTAGDDIIYGFNTADRLDGGAGNDALHGGGGGDTYVFGYGYGQDTVDAYIGYISWDFPDTVEFKAGVTAADVHLARVDSDLIVTLAGSDDELTITEQFTYYGYSTVENFTFADGTHWTSQDVELLVLAASETSGEDTIVGYRSDDTLDGGAGNDLLQGGAGNDTYVFGRGYDRDAVDDGNFSSIGDAPDRVLFNSDVVLADLEFVRVQGDLVIRIIGTDDQLTIKNQDNPYLAISTFEFADGTILTAADVDTIISNNPPGIVTHLGTASDETIVGSAGDDVIDGLAGNDLLQGGSGGDTYLYRAGSGNDRIEDTSSDPGIDQLKLVDLNSADVELTRVGNDLIVRIIESGETVTAAEQFVGHGVEQIKFANGTIWDRTDIQTHAIIFGTSGADTITGTDASETFNGLGGDDSLGGAAGSDTYIFGVGSGNDTITENAYQSGTDTARLVGLNSADVTFSRSGNDLLIKIISSGEVLKALYQFADTNNGLDQIQFADGTLWDRAQISDAAWVRGTSGNDTINGTGNDEIFDGGAGDDVIAGSTGSDTYIFGIGSGNDTVTELDYLSGTDTARLIGLNSSDVTFSRTGNDLTVTINSSGETLKAINQFGSTSGFDQIQFADGTLWDRADIVDAAWYRGTSGADTIYGDGGDNVFDGGAGNDTIDGGAGSDTYIFGVGSGNDTVNEVSYLAGTDTAKLIDLNAADVSLSRTGYDLFITINSSGETLKAFNHFHDDGNGIDQIAFADGTIWDRDDIADAAMYRGTENADTISGNAADNTFDGGAGDDAIDGGAGNDTYLFGVGSGNDTISEYGSNAGTDTVRLVGLNVADVTFARQGNDIIVTINSSGETLKFYNQFHDAGNGIDQILFANGTVWDRSDIEGAANAGIADDQTINGTGGDDTLHGGAGNDTLIGGSGSDTYLFGVGYGNDTINEYPWNSGTDTAQLVGLNIADVTFGRSGNALVIKINSTGKTLTVPDQFSDSGYGVDQVKFADGTTWDRTQIADAAWVRGTSGNDSINGTGGDETFDGGPGNDQISGSSGSDTYIFGVGSGNDTIYEYPWQSGTDTVRLSGLNVADVSFGRSGGTLLVTINSTGEVLTVPDQFNDYGIDQIKFADGTTWDRTQISNAAWIRGTSGNDTINGTGNDETFDGGPGNDTISGSTGSDTYIFGVGSGNDTIYEYPWQSGTDTVRLVGLNAADVSFGRSGGNLLVTINSTGEVLTVPDQFNDYGIDQVKFADGTTWDRTQISNAAWIRGTSGNDTINGTGSDETFDGGAGNDTIAGSTGSDTYIFGVGSGNDIITEYGFQAGTDTTRLIGLNSSDVTFSRSGNELQIKINSTGETLHAPDQFSDVGYGLDQVQFADGSVWNRAQITDAAWVRGTSGNDTINGTGGDETFDGGAGNDVVYGSTGSDTYIFRVGSGNDWITEYDFQSGTDTAKLIGLNPSDVTLSRSGDNLVITINSSGETLTAASHFSSTNGFDQVQFADGTTWDRSTIASNIWIQGTAGADNITGTSGADNINGGAGNDILNGGSGNDRLVGGTGDDTLNGGTGNNSLYGDAGTDVATGYGSGWSVVFADDHWAVTDGSAIDDLHGIEKVVINGTTYVLVDQLGQDSGGYQSVQAGVDAATNGNVVLIGSGSYTQNVSIVDKAITLDGAGRTGSSATTLHGQITVDGLLNGALAVKDLTIDATGHQYGLFVSAHSTGLAGSVTLDDVSISHATLDGFAYIRSGNGSTPTLTDTIGSVSILHSEFFGNATQTSGSNGRGDILLFGFNGDLTINDVDIHDPGAGAQKALQLRGLQDGSDVSGTGPYDAAGHVSLIDLSVTGTYQQDLLAFYRVGHFESFTASGVELNASAPWGLFNFDEVGGVIDLSSGVTTTNLSGSYIATLQGLGSADTLTGTSGSDFFDGRDGADAMNGGGGNDVFAIGSTALYDAGETINGGDGSDSVRFTSTTAGQTLTLTSAVTNIEDIRISNAAGVTTGTTALNIDASAVGGSYGLTGNNGANVLTAGAGDNTLVGGGGNDTLIGGAGNDTLTGGTGNDGFKYSANFGHDTITDFVAGAGTNDVIEFHDGLFADFSAVMASATTSGSDTIITVDTNNSIVLQNVAIASLHQDDFRFV